MRSMPNHSETLKNNLPLLSQTRFPRLWLLMQKAIGGNQCKQQLATKYYQGEARVLEIGCSVGNISDAFRVFPQLNFTGIDIDTAALKVAQRRFRNTENFCFLQISLAELAHHGEYFDYVLFAGILHHVDDATGKRLLQDGLHCTAPNGQLIISEPEALRPNDGYFMRLFHSLFEQGANLRSRAELEALATEAGMVIDLVEDHMISPGIVQRPYAARFNLLVGRNVGTTIAQTRSKNLEDC